MKKQVKEVAKPVAQVTKIESIGRALYGDRWVAQLARELKNKDGEELPQSSLKSIRNYGTLPDYIEVQLGPLIERRVKELNEAKALLGLGD